MSRVASDHHGFNVETANEVGVEAAIVIQHVRFLEKREEPDSKGFRWVTMSVSQMRETYTYWSEKQCRRILKQLVKIGILKQSKRGLSSWDHTFSYAFADIEKPIESDLPKRADRSYQTGKSSSDQTGRSLIKVTKTVTGTVVLDEKSLIPESLNTDAFKAVWKDWIEDRRERKKPVTYKAAMLQLRKCEGWGVEKAVRLINNAIEKGWQGLYETYEDKNGHIKTTQKSNPRLDGVCRGPTDYAEVARRKIARQNEECRKRELERTMAETENGSPPKAA